MHGAVRVFRSDDGTVSIADAFLDGIPPGAAPGSTVRVRFAGERHPPVVYKAGGSEEWLLIAALMLAAAGALIAWALTVRARLTGRLLPWTLDRPQFRRSRDGRAPDKTGHKDRSGATRRKRATRRRSAG